MFFYYALCQLFFHPTKTEAKKEGLPPTKHVRKKDTEYYEKAELSACHGASETGI